MIRVGLARSEVEAGVEEQTRHLFGVVHVHLAPGGADVEAISHEAPKLSELQIVAQQS